MTNFIQHLNDYILNDERIIMVLKNDGFKQVLKDAIESYEKENGCRMVSAEVTDYTTIERRILSAYFKPHEMESEK